MKSRGAGESGFTGIRQLEYNRCSLLCQSSSIFVFDFFCILHPDISAHPSLWSCNGSCHFLPFSLSSVAPETWCFWLKMTLKRSDFDLSLPHFCWDKPDLVLQNTFKKKKHSGFRLLVSTERSVGSHKKVVMHFGNHLYSRKHRNRWNLDAQGHTVTFPAWWIR